MTTLRRICLRALACLVWLVLVPVASVTAQAPALSTPEIEARVDRLLGQMTLEEKAGQLSQYSEGLPTGPGTNRETYEALIAAGRVGSLFNVTERRRVDAYQKVAVETSRLHIPLLFGLDVIHGFRTIVPIPLGLSATWDLPLIEQTARLAATESAAQGVRWTFSPMVDIARDARWGRIAEGAGEDPTLGAAVAGAMVHGYQGRALDEPTSILACAKHFVAYGAAEGGRDYNTTEVSERTLRQIYLPPFLAAIEAGAATVMAGFNALNGVPASANATTLGGVLRGEWGFQGLVVSDWGSVGEIAVHGIASDGGVAARKAFLAGVDLDMESDLYRRELPALVTSGVVPLARLDEAVRRVLRLKFALGLFEHPYARGDAGAAGRPLPADSLDLARRAAEESFVLLKNDVFAGGPVLPLTAGRGRTLALIGPLADSAKDMLGSWSAEGRPADVVTLRAALAERAAREKMTLLYAPGIDPPDADGAALSVALAAARGADVVVLALGEEAQFTGEAASRTRLDLDADQHELLRAVMATGKPVVLVLFSGRPLTISWADRFVPAILAAWFPGVQAGPALERVLFGDATPSGHLTASWPRAVGQEPLYYNSLSTGRPSPPGADLSRPPATPSERYTSRYLDEQNTPLYPFGHGLSYATFAWSPVTVSARTLSAAAINDQGASLVAAADVTCAGDRPGATVVQLYVRLTGTSVARPVRQLEGFQRVELAVGETRRVEFRLGKAELSFWNLEMQEVAEPATLSVWIAPDSVSGTPAEVTLTE